MGGVGIKASHALLIVCHIAKLITSLLIPFHRFSDTPATTPPVSTRLTFYLEATKTTWMTVLSVVGLLSGVVRPEQN
jgi:hypothetical protein